jgi:predicted amidohydrolase YtcJ
LGEMEFYQMLHARGLLTLRTTTAFSAGSGTRHTLSPEELETFESGRARFSGDWVRSGVIKFFMDGVVETHTAELLTPYADQSTNRGHVYYPPNTFAKMLVELDRRGFNVMTHAIGDGAVRATLDGYEAAIHANGSRDRRWRIEHIEVCHPADVGRFAKLNVIASMQPYHFCCPTPDLSDAWSRNLGRARLREGFVWHDIAATGAVMVHGSDWPVVTIDPLIGIYSGVTREDPHGQPAGGWFPNQRLRMDQVIAGYTRNASYAAFMDDRIGTLEVGKKADLVALSHDLTSIPSSEILNTQIAMTIVDGRVVHEGSATVNRTAELPTRPGDQCACHRLARSVFA